MFLQFKRCFLTILLLLFFRQAYTQDVHFSQRLVASKEINPSFLNNFDGKWQAATDYRQQWQAVGVPFTTAGVFYTHQFYTPIKQLKAFGGLQFYNDKSGEAQLMLNQIGLNIGASYTTADLGVFTLGVSNNFVNKSFNKNGLTYPEQYDRNTGGFNENLPSGESYFNEDINYYNLSVGGRWEKQLVEKWKINTGFSLNNITQPQESFMSIDNHKKLGYGIQLIADHSYRVDINILPYISFYRSNRASETVIGSAVSFETIDFGMVDNIQPFLYFRSGFWRNTDAFIVGSRFQINQFDFGLSYDLNISDLEMASNYRGGFEITLSYTAKEKKLQKRRLPCVRY